MNRRKFLAAVGAITALPTILVVPAKCSGWNCRSGLPPKPGTSLCEKCWANGPPGPEGTAGRGQFEIMSPEEIGKYFVYVPTACFVAHSFPLSVKCWFTKSRAYADDWLNHNQHERDRLQRECFAYIHRWFDFYRYVWDGKAHVRGPYVHSVELCRSQIWDPDNRPFHRAIFRATKLIYSGSKQEGVRLGIIK